MQSNSLQSDKFILQYNTHKSNKSPHSRRPDRIKFICSTECITYFPVWIASCGESSYIVPVPVINKKYIILNIYHVDFKQNQFLIKYISANIITHWPYLGGGEGDVFVRDTPNWFGDIYLILLFHFFLFCSRIHSCVNYVINAFFRMVNSRTILKLFIYICVRIMVYLFIFSKTFSGCFINEKTQRELSNHSAMHCFRILFIE